MNPIDRPWSSGQASNKCSNRGSAQAADKETKAKSFRIRHIKNAELVGFALLIVRRRQRTQDHTPKEAAEHCTECGIACSIKFDLLQQFERFSRLRICIRVDVRPGFGSYVKPRNIGEAARSVCKPDYRLLVGGSRIYLQQYRIPFYRRDVDEACGLAAGCDDYGDYQYQAAHSIPVRHFE